MKNEIIFTIVFTLIFALSLQGQGNLEFNQVIFMELTGVSATGTSRKAIDQKTLVVPAGKVLKIESVSTGDTQNDDHGCGYGSIFLNDKCIHSSDGKVINFPIWLKEGSYIIKLVTSTNYAWTINGFISGIEFNVITN